MSGFFISVESLPQDGYGFFQLLFLGGVYGYILMYGSTLISDGSELLLLVPSMAGVVGSIVLPILGAVPDGCMVFFSGMGPNAQEQLNVGVGALAGSTIMLLTIPWFLAVLGGRVNIDKETQRPRYKQPKLSPPGFLSLNETGVIVSRPVNMAAYTILLTALSYFILQIPGLFYLNASKEKQAAGEKTWAMIGLGVCTLFFVRYLVQQYNQSDETGTIQEISRDQVVRDAIANKTITLAGVMTAELAEYRVRHFTDIGRRRAASYDATIEEGIALKDRSVKRYATTVDNKDFITDEFLLHLQRILKPFFALYDPDNSGSLDRKELRAVFTDLGESLTDKELDDIFRMFDSDRSGSIEYLEFVRGTASYIANHERILKKNQLEKSQKMSEMLKSSDKGRSNADIVTESEEDGDESEEVPEDIKDLSPEEQQKRIKLRAAWMMGLGTLLVMIISDPMVEVMSEIGKRTNIPGFYIAFVLAPLASNASEVIAAYNYAQKKTVTTITISMTTLEGACIMNNTFVLGIFMLLICTQNLAWEFFAETLTILFVQVVIALMALKDKHTVRDAFFILALYPLSLALKATLESYGWD